MGTAFLSSPTSGLFDVEDPAASPSTPDSPFAPANLFNVRGMVAVITGGATGTNIFREAVDGITACLAGIGLMMATALESNGATVYILGRRLGRLEEAAQENNVRV